MHSKNRFIIISGLALHVLAGDALSQETEANAPQGFTVNEGVSSRIYQESRATISSAGSSPLRVESSLRIFFPSDFSLVNKYFEVPYADNTNSITGINIGPSIPLLSLGRASLDTFMRLGYAYSQGIYDVRAESGLDVKDAVELQWIPAQAGLEFTSAPFLAGWMQAGAFSSAGIDWFTQSGQLDGMNQTFWVPRLELGGSMTVLSGTDSNSSSSAASARTAGGFEGIKFSASTYRSFASKQKNRGWAADVGARYAF